MSPVDQQLLFASGKLISISEAAKGTPYSAEYLSLLARKGRLKAIKISRDWLTTRDAVLEYIKKQAAKHEKMLVSLKGVSFNSAPTFGRRLENVRIRAKRETGFRNIPPSLGERGRV